MAIKFLCINLWLHPTHPPEGVLLKQALRFISREKPDIIALQEVYNNNRADLPLIFRAYQAALESSGLPYHHFAPTFEEPTEHGVVTQGNAVFSRFPIVGKDVIYYDHPFGLRNFAEVDWKNLNPDSERFANWAENTPRNLQHVIINMNGTELNVFNTQGIWGKDGGDNPRRLAMSDTIIRAIKGKKNNILAGDLNTDERTVSISNIQNHLTDIFRGQRQTSFNLRRKSHPGFSHAVVDFVFVSPNIKVVSKSSPDSDVSDHLPILAVLEPTR